MQAERIIRSGRLSVEVREARARCLSFEGVEILQELSAPVRDGNWGSFRLVVDDETVDQNKYVCRFSEPSSLFSGVFRIEIESELRCTADFTLQINNDVELNRAGFCLLHSIREVRGSPMTVLHPDGSAEQVCFPHTISPSQPAINIAGLGYRVGRLTLSIGMEGDVFEMEDQRNWSDASFKTYCRPLSLPYPYTVYAGDVIHQRVTMTITDVSNNMSQVRSSREEGTARLPKVFLAFDPELASLNGLAQFPTVPVLARLSSDTTLEMFERLADIQEVGLELVFDDLSDICALAEKCRRAQLRPTRVVALPRLYLKSYQPQGPWPTGATPDQAIPVARAAFPGIAIGGGSLTNFTEFNRCPPSADADFLTFGNTAIVHAADDTSVIQTLGALPDIFASAKALRPGKPMHLGLFSIGMRSNPYGSKVQSNPCGEPTPMARWDRRQETEFAAAYAVGVLAQASLAGVTSIALAMPDGELGAAGHPVGEVISFAQRNVGSQVEILTGENRYTISAGGALIVGDLSHYQWRIPSGDSPIPASRTFRLLETK